MWGSGKGKLRDGAGMAAGLKSEAGPGIRSLGIFGKTSIWHLRWVFWANSGIFGQFCPKSVIFGPKPLFWETRAEIRPGLPVLPPTDRARPRRVEPLRNHFGPLHPSRRLILAKTGQKWRNWLKMAKIGQN